ncbi:MAG: Ppx/GppA family phosphatase [Methanomicrobiales archaeon]|nr:Ppx/GppA family phosphatase [Methanomicrobiales archaeon]
MTAATAGRDGRVVAFVDIGTNSVRLLVVRLNPNHSYTILTRQKQVVRLGEGEFDEDEIRSDAAERLILVCRTFADLARTFAAEEFVAVATSAMREATNQHEILHRLRKEANLDVRVISGQEEARLIYLGVASGVHLEDRQAFFIDIGGGSTEIAVGGEKSYHYLHSFRLGAIRLANLYSPEGFSDPVSPAQYRKIQDHVKDAIVRSTTRLKKETFDCAIGSSGTIMNLAEIAQRTLPPRAAPAEPVLTLADLRRVIDLLCSLPLEQRRKIPGINPERADIIIPGAAILETFMKELGLRSIAITSRGLQDGLLADYLSRMDAFPLLGELSPRQRSVLQLGRSCGINEAHARTVTSIVLELFDSSRDLGLHACSDRDRELLEYASFLHDIGSFISYTNHQAHSFYIIRNSELLGFDEREITFMAYLARFHRKKTPKKKDMVITDLGEHDQETLRLLTPFIRLAETLDRSHTALIQHVRFSHVDKESVSLEVVARGDCQLEIWGIESEKKAFEKTFGRKLVFEIIDSRSEH